MLVGVCVALMWDISCGTEIDPNKVFALPLGIEGKPLGATKIFGLNNRSPLLLISLLAYNPPPYDHASPAWSST